MSSKILIPLFATVLIAIMGIYFLVNPSYQQSIKAKYYFEMSEYDKAYAHAKEAFGLDLYNRMAATVMAQSQISLKYVRYIDMGKKYMLEIDKIAHLEKIEDSDKAKIRLICEIMKSDYIKLAPSVITDKNLVQESAKYYSYFEKLLEKVTR